MLYKNLAKNCLFLILIIFLGFYSFVIAQEEKQTQQAQQNENKISIEKITEKLKNFQNEIFFLWEKAHQGIVEIWKQKKLPQITLWLKKEASFIKEEFRKEKQEMEQDIKKIFGEKFGKIIYFQTKRGKRKAKFLFSRASADNTKYFQTKRVPLSGTTRFAVASARRGKCR